MSLSSLDSLLIRDQPTVAYDRLVIAGAAIYVYDRLLTVGREFELIWGQRKTGIVIPIVLASMHLSMVFTLILGIDFMTPPRSCKSYYILYIVAALNACFLYLVCGAASALRTFAVNGRKYGLPVMIILVSTVPVAANIANIASVTMAPTLPSMTCTIVWSIGTPVMRNLEIVTRVSIMTGDAMVLLAMWRAIGGLPKVTAVLHAKVSIASRLLRDGTLYFSALLLMNALVLALYILPTNFAGKNMGSLPDIAAVVLLSRLFLNLREAAFSPATVLSTTEAQMSASDLTFARVLGVLGSSMIEEDSCHSEELESSGDGETCEAEVSGDEHIADEGSGAAEFKTITIHSSGDNGLLEAADGSPRGRQGASADKDPLIKLLERIA